MIPALSVHPIPGGGTMFARIVVGTDGSDTAKQAVHEATELAKTTNATLYIVSAFDPVPASRLREERLEAPDDIAHTVNPSEDVNATLAEASADAKDSGLDVQTIARQGEPADAILDAAEEQNADLIVVGNKGMTGAKRFLLGSVPNKVSHHAPCSVLIVRTT
jgi:nucleotide-binding universal stress UspA family protein